MTTRYRRGTTTAPPEAAEIEGAHLDGVVVGLAGVGRLQGMVMPAWKYNLSDTERWQVIAYPRTLGEAEAK